MIQYRPERGDTNPKIFFFLVWLNLWASLKGEVRKKETTCSILQRESNNISCSHQSFFTIWHISDFYSSFSLAYKFIVCNLHIADNYTHLFIYLNNSNKKCNISLHTNEKRKKRSLFWLEVRTMLGLQKIMQFLLQPTTWQVVSDGGMDPPFFFSTTHN